MREVSFGMAVKYRMYTLSADWRRWNEATSSASSGRMGRRWTVPPSVNTTSVSHRCG